MKYLKQFTIPVAGLDKGTHHYEFDVDEKFFESAVECEIRKCSIHFGLELIKQEDMITLCFDYSGIAGLICDRCLDPFEMKIAGREEINLKFRKASEKLKPGEEIIQPEQHELDLWQYLSDIVRLKIPFRRVHPEDENGKSQCNPEVIRKIEELSGAKEPDARWDELKKIQNS